MVCFAKLLWSLSQYLALVTKQYVVFLHFYESREGGLGGCMANENFMWTCYLLLTLPQIQRCAAVAIRGTACTWVGAARRGAHGLLIGGFRPNLPIRQTQITSPGGLCAPIWNLQVVRCAQSYISVVTCIVYCYRHYPEVTKPFYRPVRH